MERNMQMGLQLWRELERKGVSLAERERRTASYWTEDLVLLKKGVV
jgi:hypothetical protein